MITLPKKAPPQYMKKREIDALAKRNNISDWMLRKVLGPESAARKLLPGCERPLYVRRVVHELLGLQDEANP